MIVTVFGPDAAVQPPGAAHSVASLLAPELAHLRRAAGRRVRLFDAGRYTDGALGAHIELQAARWPELVVDAGSMHGHAWRAALIAARVALVPLAPGDADPLEHYRLAACLNAARMFNPGLRVLFVPADAGGVGLEGIAAVRRYACEVMAAHVTATTLDTASMRTGAGARATLARLYAEVYGETDRVQRGPRIGGRLALP